MVLRRERGGHRRRAEGSSCCCSCSCGEKVRAQVGACERTRRSRTAAVVGGRHAHLHHVVELGGGSSVSMLRMGQGLSLSMRMGLKQRPAVPARLRC